MKPKTKDHLLAAFIALAIGLLIFTAFYSPKKAEGKPPVPTRPTAGAGSMEFHYSPAVESVKFRHPAFTTITCSTRTGLTMEEPPTAGTVTGFSTAPFARIALCISDKPMVEVP